jgi:hypothetical protein
MNIPCDGNAGCTNTLSLECACSRCRREHEATERFHTCAEHFDTAGARHEHVRGKQALWGGYDTRPGNCPKCPHPEHGTAYCEGFDGNGCDCVPFVGQGPTPLSVDPLSKQLPANYVARLELLQIALNDIEQNSGSEWVRQRASIVRHEYRELCKAQQPLPKEDTDRIDWSEQDELHLQSIEARAKDPMKDAQVHMAPLDDRDWLIAQVRRLI